MLDIPLFDRTSNGNCGFLGFRMCQNRLAVAVLSYIIEQGKFARVIELGTQLGGLTALLGLQCRMQDVEMYTFDVQATSPYVEWLHLFGVHYQLGNIFSGEGVTAIRSLIEAPGRVLLLCDNGDKIRELHTFAPFLKTDDLIGAHDYQPDADCDEKRWGWHEVRDADVKSICEEHHLASYLPAACAEAAWLMRIKQ